MKTMSLKEGESSPPATIDRIAWMAGSFKGELFGGQGEEVWNPPSYGSMMGMFKYSKDGKPGFYEILTISEENGSLVLRIKHFNPDLSSWEDKDKCMTFPLVKITADTAWFDGITYMRNSESVCTHIIRQGKKDSELHEVEVVYRRE